MEPLDDVDALATVFPEDEGLPPGISSLGAQVATRPQPEVPAAFPVDALLAPVFRAFEQAGVRWCLVRAPEKATGEGVLALVDRSALGDARRILKAHGFAPFSTWGSGPHARFVGYDPEADRWVTLDVVTRLTYGPYSELETGAEGGCLERRRWEGGIWVLAPDDAFWTLLLRVLLDDPSPDPHLVQRIERLAVEARPDGPLARLMGSFLPAKWSPEAVVDCVWEGDWDILEQLAPFLAEDWARRQAAAARRRAFANRMLRRASGERLLPTPRGLSVALLGPDPAAKSHLANELGRTFYLPVTYVRMSAPPRRRRSSRRLARAGFFSTLLTQWQRYLVGRRRRAKGRLVVFDRYTYDARITPARRLPPLARLRRLVLGRACPAPDLVVILDTPAPTRPRKIRSDVPHETLRQSYLELSQRLPDAIVVEGGAGPDHLRREITARLWRAYAAAPPTAWLPRLQTYARRLSRT